MKKVYLFLGLIAILVLSACSTPAVPNQAAGQQAPAHAEPWTAVSPLLRPLGSRVGQQGGACQTDWQGIDQSLQRLQATLQAICVQ